MLRIGIDTGGTFTDFVILQDGQVRVFKLPSTPEHPERAVLSGLSRILREDDGYLLQLGSTVATNALLERKGANTLLITNEGFEDIIEIGRQNRPELYKLGSSRPEPLVPSRYRVGLRERTLWDKTEWVPLEKKSLDWLRGKVDQLKPESIAVVLLYSYLNPENEQRVAAALKDSDIPVSLSHQILPEFREYERTSTTLINAYVRPIMTRYLEGLSSDDVAKRGRINIMQSNGGSISIESASQQPVRTLFSGPAGGVVGAFEVASRAGFQKIITFDMGGTSTDVCLCDGRIDTTKEAMIDHHPVSVQMLGIHTVGAGGGSVAWVDEGGLLRVGPASAGADPGPVCYGKGSEITVTDANVFLGRIEPDYFLGGEMSLFPEKIPKALNALGDKLNKAAGRNWSPVEIAEGIIRITNTQLEGAVRVISLQKGYDTRDFTLVTYGGAGGLHACNLARALLIPRVLVPLNPGTLSANGILHADIVKDNSLTVLLRSDDSELRKKLEDAFQSLEEPIRKELSESGFSDENIQLEKTVDVRYLGQSYELTTPFDDGFRESFHKLHEQFYGYSNLGLPLEIVNVRLIGRASFPEHEVESRASESADPPLESMIQETQVVMNGRETRAGFYLRGKLNPGNRIQGPAVILEYSGTTVVPDDFVLQVDKWMNLIIQPVDKL